MEEKQLIATGIDVHGEKTELDCTGGGLVYINQQLISLTVPEGVMRIWCQNNKLKELTLPKGVTHVCCRGNNITHLDLPDSVTYLYADKKVAGLEKYIGKNIEIELL